MARLASAAAAGYGVAHFVSSALLSMQSDAGVRPVRVWDLPTRLFHWLLAAAVIGAVVTAKVGGNAMVWHTRLGLMVLALLVFRLAWGFVGGHWSRFASFAYGPASVRAYLRGDSGPGGRFDIGHSPLGALSVFALLAVLVLQVATGLVADDEVATVGPLNRFVEVATGLKATAWHERVGQYLIIALVVAHVGAVLYYLQAKRRNLIAPMWHGDKPLAPDTPASADGWRQRLLALVLIAIGLGLAGGIARLGAM
jgi:cytochrome b